MLAFGRFVIIGVLSVTALSACQTTESSPEKMASLDCTSAPLPEFEIMPPPANTPEDIARFSGEWKGKWGGSLCSRLAIVEVSPDGTATGYYAWGKTNNFDAGFSEIESKIADGELKFGSRRKFTFNFENGSNDVLSGKAVAADTGSVDRISMVREKRKI
ncbi:MAG: hypothetical protein K9G33_10370 [Sneathiella sp.]|nr:hypothetical protein [Sneathiella sp.]